MQYRQLGVNGPVVSAFGLGCMGMSGGYGPASRIESIATIHAALDAGLTLIDTGDFYAMGHNEMLIGEALRGRKRDEAVISVKFGAMRDPDSAFLGMDGRPRAVKNFLSYTLQRLGVDYVDIYRPARRDPDVPIEETVGAIAELVEAGHVRHIGLSEVGAETIQRAAQVHPICDLQVEYSLLSRGIEAEVLPTCRTLGVAITAYGVLSRGLISSDWHKNSLAADDSRTHLPRFTGENLDMNLGLVDELRKVAATKQVTVAQIAFAWVAAQGEDIVPLIGTKSRDRLNEGIEAADIVLTPADLSAIERAVPKGSAAGSRYPTALMNTLEVE